MCTMARSCTLTQLEGLSGVAVGEEHLISGLVSGDVLKTGTHDVVHRCPLKLLSCGLVALHAFAVLLQVQLEWFYVVVKSQRRHCEENVLAVDGLSLLGLE